jgi:hypothetical protein
MIFLAFNFKFTGKFTLKILGMIKQLNLYSTSHCHLCELAHSLVVNMPDIIVRVIDIADNETLLALYGVRIPVLQRQDSKAELNWPFNAAEIRALLK